MSRQSGGVIQRKGDYYIEGKKFNVKPPLTDGRTWVEDKHGDFHAEWPLAPYVQQHEKRKVPTLSTYKELGLGRHYGLEASTCVGSKKIVIGIPYRDDAFGISLRKDAILVRMGTGCSVRILYGPPKSYGNEIDALYLPGGPFDLPGTKLITDQMVPQRESQLAEWKKRLDLQEAWIKWADAMNKPVLGVCGGSRRLAQFSGGQTEHLTSYAQKMHRGNYQDPCVIKHTVTVSQNSKLGKMIMTGNYRALPEEAQKGLQELLISGAISVTSKDIIIDVNSVHWAQSSFGKEAQNINLCSFAPDKTLEGWERIDKPFWVGVQWHPEYGQTGMGDFGKREKPHANIMKALGQAATEGVAAEVLQSAVRTFLAQKALQAHREELRRREDEERRYALQEQFRRQQQQDPELLVKAYVFNQAMGLVAKQFEKYQKDGGYKLF